MSRRKLIRRLRKAAMRRAESAWPLRSYVIRRDAAIADRDAAISERDAAIAERDAAIAERDAAILIGLPSTRDRELTGDAVARKPNLFHHGNIWKWLATVANSNNVKVLELGSREVTEPSARADFIPRAIYTGFDYLPGSNVDVVGDAHKLSTYFPESTFDFVISLAVFEHLAMPWIVAEEISKVLKIGGMLGIETHFSFSEHEMPWHFFQFNSEALKVLFNPSLGFEVLDSGLFNPMVGRFSLDASEYLAGRPVNNLYCHSSILARKTTQVLGSHSPPFAWRSLIDAITGESSYPEGTEFNKRAAG